MALSLGVTGRAAPGAFSPWLGPALAASEAPGPGPAPAPFPAGLHIPLSRFFFFLFYAQLSFPSCLQGLLRPHSRAGGKCQGWSMIPLPDVSVCCSSGQDPIKTFFPYGGKEKGSCSQEPATNSRGALCQEEIFFCLPASFPELCQAD